MSLRITCPSCQAMCMAEEAYRGKQLRCGKCGKPFLVPPAVPASSVKAPSPSVPMPNPAAAVAARPPVPAKPPNQAVTASRPAAAPAAAAGPTRPGPQVKPAPKGNPRAPAAGKTKAGASLLGLPLPLVLAGAGAGALALVGIVVVLILVLGSGGGTQPQTAQAQQSTPAKEADSQQPKTEPKELPPKTEPKELPPKLEAPPEPPPATPAPATVQKVKRSTAYLRVTLHNGTTAEGSGFFGAEPGVVLTNAHVLGMLQADGRKPSAVEVVVSSGEADEVRMAGQVLGVDRDSDLAVLRVVGDAARMPAPLTIGTAAGLTELQKVLIFGFPFGAQLGKNITVSESSVSSLRRGDDGQLSQVQVNGGMNPGNSGGPVTDTRGVVVGVSVSGIRGTQINFAIPADFVHGILNGRVAEHSPGEPYLDNAQQKLPVRLTCLDPLQRIRDLKVEVWTGDPGKSRPSATARPAPQPGDGPRQAVAVRYANGEGNAEVALPGLAVGKVYWLQPMLSSAAGTSQWGPAITFRPTSLSALERRNALIQLQCPEIGQVRERTLKLKAIVKATAVDARKTRVISHELEADLLESFSGNPIGAGILLPFGGCKFAAGIDGRQIPRSPQAQATLRQLPPRFDMKRNGLLNGRADPNFRALPGDVRFSVEEMYQEVCNAFEATCLSTPNRLLAPMESWQSRQPMLIALDGEKEFADMFLTCSLQGVRSNAGRNEAYFKLSGEVKSRGPAKDAIEGKVSGHGLFDIDQGFFSEIKLHITSEMDLPGGLRLAIQSDIELSRTTGNSLGITVAPPRPGPEAVVKGRVVFSNNGALTFNDPADGKGRRMKIHGVQMMAGKKYIIEMNQVPGSRLDPYLRLEDITGNLIAEDDDSGGFPNARIVFTAPRSDFYKLVATSYQPNETGAYILTVSEAAGP